MLGKSGATLTLPAFDFNTTKIVVTGKSGASSSVGQNIYVGSNAVSTATTGATGTNTYSINAANQAAGNVYILKVTSSHNTQITKIEVYGESNSTEPPTPANPYKVTLEAGPGTCAESVTEASAGAGVSLPTPTLDCGDWEFAGWTTSSVATETTSKPEILLTGTYSPSTDITLYAVYKRTETTEGGGDTSVKFTDDDSGGWTTTAGKQTGSKDGVTISTNNGIYSQNNNQLRVYKDATFTVSSTNTIISIIFSSSNYDWSAYDVGTYKNKTWTGQGNSVTFTAGNGQVRITQLVVTTSGGASTTYYHSTPECAAPCTDAVTISKGTLSNGSFTLDKTGEQSTCNGAVTVTLSDIQPAAGYKFSAITQTGVDASKVTINNTAKTVTYAKNTTGTSTINVTFTELPKYTVSFSTGTGNPTQADITESVGGQGITLPVGPVPACTDWTFAGWAEADVTETTTEPTLFAEGTNYKPVGNCTLYAVYNTTAETTGFTGYEKVTEEPEDWTGKYLLSTGTYTATGAFDANGEKGHLVRTTYSPSTDEKTEWEFTLDKVGTSGYSILFPDDTWFLGYDDGTNFARTIHDPSQNVAYLWTPSPEGISHMSETTRKIQDGGSDFRPYAQKETIVYLYKRIEGVVYTTVYNSNPTCTPPVEYTITWWANGEKCHTQTAVEGKAIDVPASSDVATYACDDKVFVGWVDAEISGSTNTEPTFITDFDKITENKDYFAVFATETSVGVESTIHTLTPSNSWSGYEEGTIKDDKDLTWSYCAGGQQTSGVYSLNLRNKTTEISYIASPVFAANVKNIKATIVNGSDSKARKVYVCSAPTLEPTTGDLGITEVAGGHSGELSLAFEGTISQFYLQVSDALQFQSIVVEVGATTTYSSYVTTCPYTITFNNWDNTELASYEVAYGQTPKYAGATPTKAADAQYTYTFSGWDPEIAAVTGDQTYTAQYTETINKYTITFNNWDNTELASYEVEYGQTPKYAGATPTKAADAQYTYTFSGWDPEIAAVTGDQTYTAQYTETINKYTITFNNWDDTELASYEVEYGQTPEYKGATPTKAADAQYTYTFSGWDKEIVSVTGDVVYTAQFDATVNKYTITFNNWDGTTLATYEVEYGQTPVYAGEAPTKVATAEHTYTFTGWTPAIAAVTGEATYTATYSQTLNQYTISVTATNGTVIGAGTYNYGTEVTLTATADFDYEFVNWIVGSEVVSTDNPYTFPASANVEVVANFQGVAATTAKSGKFSTGKYEYAEFATGNLQYKPSTKTWRFAKQQYQYVGKDNIYVGKEDYKGWIDLFGWSADDKFGVNPSNDNTNYQGEFVDWGTLFPEEGWSTLSKNQWNYLLNQRTNAASLKQIAMIGETLGIMLFPDKWTLPADCEPTKQTHHDEEDGEDHSCDFVSYNYTLAQWAELENAGAIFLPAAGRRTGGWGNETISPHMTGKAELDADGHYKHYADYYAYYWTSTKTDGKVNYLINCTLVDKVKDTYTVHAGHVDWAEEARYGQSVRLAKVTSTLIEIGDGDNSEVITENANKTINVQLNRSFTANVGYYTLCLPFDIAASEIGTAYELGTITEYEANGGININLTEVEHIEAGKPYLVLPKTLTKPIFENVTIVNTTGETIEPASGAGVNVTFTGIINGVGEETNGTTHYYVGDNGYLYNGKVAKLGLRAFFTITNGEGQAISNVRARVVAGENVETGVEEIITTDAPVKVIENGQLIIIRDGVKYNVQGQRL